MFRNLDKDQMTLFYLTICFILPVYSKRFFFNFFFLIGELKYLPFLLVLKLRPSDENSSLFSSLFVLIRSS